MWKDHSLWQPPPPPTMKLMIHPFIQQTFTGHLLCACMPGPGGWGTGPEWRSSLHSSQPSRWFPRGNVSVGGASWGRQLICFSPFITRWKQILGMDVTSLLPSVSPRLWTPKRAGTVYLVTTGSPASSRDLECSWSSTGIEWWGQMYE